jgi:hypothetical protein
MGFVYVFNATVQSTRLSLGEQPRTSVIQPVAPPSARAPYTPSSIQVVRSDVQPPSGNAFVNGQSNTVVVEVREQTSQPVDVPIPADGEPTTDLWIYLYATVLLLIDTTGHVHCRAPLQWNS